MKLIYKARNTSEAHIISGMLKARHIPSHVGGHYLQGGIGDLAAMDFATVYVADEDINLAESIIADYESKNEHTKSDNKKDTSIISLPLIGIGIALFVLLIFLFKSKN